MMEMIEFSDGSRDKAPTSTNVSSDEDSDSLTLASGLIPASSINENDILCGRGAGCSKYSGNKRFRELVLMYQEEYFTVNILEKTLIAERIVNIIANRSPPGRFLRAVQENKTSNTNSSTTLYCMISNRAAKEKTSQALRERTSNVLIPRRNINQGLPDATRNDHKLSQEEGMVSMPDINDNDVLCGRGGITNFHVGNVRFRNLVKSYRPLYLAAPKMKKAGLAREIVDIIRSSYPPGRFLQMSTFDHGGCWVDIGNDKAREKTSQALREGAPEVKNFFSAAAKMIASKNENYDRMEFREVLHQPRSTSLPKEGNYNVCEPSVHQSRVASYSPLDPIQHPNGLIEEISNSRNDFAVREDMCTGENIGLCCSQGQQDLRRRHPVNLDERINEVKTNECRDVDVRELDVLLGRGAAINYHFGNRRYRQLISEYRPAYYSAAKNEKAAIARDIVDIIRNASSPGRFLSKDPVKQGVWVEVSEGRAREKVSQALREQQYHSKSTSVNNSLVQDNWRTAPFLVQREL